MNILIPMNATQFADYLEQAIPTYAAGKVTAVQWSEAESITLSRQAFAELLPQGIATPDNYLYTIQDATGQSSVGILWISALLHGGKRIAFIYDVLVQPAYQRQGYATRALTALEDEVRALGLSGIALHVFGHNTGAQALYAKLGYTPTNINMYKALS